MRWFILRIEMIRPYYVLEHTAYKQAYRHLTLCILRGKNKERSYEPEKPPPARAVLQSRLLNAYQAADDSQSCEVDRSFCFPGHEPRCRSPPSQSVSFAPSTYWLRKGFKI